MRFASFLAAALALLLVCPPAFAAEAADAPKGAAPAITADPGASEARISKMRDRWRKMTPEQKEEMRAKADRRLQERYERLSPQEQTQVNGIVDEVAKLSREQRSIFFARVHQKAYKERTQKKLMKDQETRPVATPAEAPKADNTLTISPTAATPAAPAPAAVSPAAPAAAPAPAAPAVATPAPAPAEKK